MNNANVIEIKDISKIFKLYEKPSDRLREIFSPIRTKKHKDFYALDQINIQVKKGETLGIIGKNGSGKSTLLKLITGILTPSNGKIEINGKISALLELGAGFNPDFTGIQNVYLNGTLMGYSKEEMDNKMEAIIEFADIGDFINQPVKTYSSGMFVRLAFAVAINVDPEILIVDEALSVGDVRFQQKCFRKINEFKEQGTVLFCSHDMGAISNFCDRVIWLNEGKIIREGKPDEILEEFHAFMNYGALTKANNEFVFDGNFDSSLEMKNEIDILPISRDAKSFGRKGALISGASILNHTGQVNGVVKSGEIISILIRIEVKELISFPILGFVLKDRLGNSLLIVNTEFQSQKIHEMKPGEIKTFKWTFKFPMINEGSYTIDLAIAEGFFQNHDQHHWINDALIVNVENNNKYSYAQGVFIPEQVQLLEL